MNNETATAVTAEAVTAAATQAAASQKIAAKSIAETSTQETTDRSSWLKVITTSVLSSLVVALIVLAFTWPTKTMEAKNLPVSIAGPEVTVSQFEQSLKDQGIETFDLKQDPPAKRLNSKSSSAKPTAQSSSPKAPPPKC